MPENEKLPSPVNLKHRLIGAVILVSVAVILVPLILSEQEPPAELKTVSDAPDKSVVPVSAPAPVASEYTLPEPPSEPAPEQKPAAPPAVKAPADDSMDGGGRATQGAVAGATKPFKGWVVQVGIFANAGNATRLSERLKQQGHAVLLDSISQNNEKRTRLRVGPFADKDAAQQAQAKIQQQAGVVGAIVAYP